MALRFRQSMKLFPGVRFNLGKKSASVRVGGKGFGYTVGTAGKRVTAGIPGSGLSYTEKLPTNRQQPSTLLAAFGWLALSAIALVAILYFF